MNAAALVLAFSMAATPPTPDLPRGGLQAPHFWFAYTVACSAVLVVVILAVSPHLPAGEPISDEEFDRLMKQAQGGTTMRTVVPRR